MFEWLTWPDGSKRALLVDGVCILCRNTGEVWMSGRMVPCVCPSVEAANHRLRERVAELEAAITEEVLVT